MHVSKYFTREGLSEEVRKRFKPKRVWFNPLLSNQRGFGFFSFVYPLFLIFLSFSFDFCPGLSFVLTCFFFVYLCFGLFFLVGPCFSLFSFVFLEFFFVFLHFSLFFFLFFFCLPGPPPLPPPPETPLKGVGAN